jgi:L-malate glycosyltransferase
MQARLRIGISCYASMGGSGVVATEIGICMARRGHRVHFVCNDVPRRLHRDRFIDNIFLHHVDVRNYPVFPHAPYALAVASKMTEVASYEKLDLFHVHYAVPHATSAFLMKEVLGKDAPRVITTLHGTDITLVGIDRAYLPITRFSIARSDGVTAPSKYLKHATYDKLNVSTEVPIEVIPNFIDTELYTPVWTSKGAVSRESIFPPGDTRVIAHVSNFRAVKRVDDVVRVFAEVIREVPSRLMLIGDGPERSRIEAMVRDFGLTEHVRFLGNLDGVVELLQRCDLFILPSENEGFGLAALEAMSCGVPVIATRVEGLPEVVVDGTTGFLFGVGDTARMARAAKEILMDPSLHANLAQNARNRALEFRVESVIPKYEEYYYRVLERTRPSKGAIRK